MIIRKKFKTASTYALIGLSALVLSGCANKAVVSYPVVFVERIKNKTSEHIDTESITDSISTQLLRSGKFRFVDMTRVEAIREQLKFQNEDALVNPTTAVAFGKQIGAPDVYYKFTMRLMDMESGLVEWADETEIRKTKEKSTFGW